MRLARRMPMSTACYSTPTAIKRRGARLAWGSLLRSVVWAAAAGIMAGCARTGELSQVSAFLSESMYRVETPTGLGSAFSVSEGAIVTSGHVLPLDEAFAVTLRATGRGAASYRVVRGGQGPGLLLRDDWAVLRRMAGPSAPHHEIPIAGRPPAPGTRVYIAGLLESDMMKDAPSPRLVTAVVREPPSPMADAMEQGAEDVVTWVEWPPGFAAFGFSGGPAFMVARGGEVQLCGFTVALDYRDGRQFAIVRRLTPEILEAAGIVGPGRTGGSRPPDSTN